MANRWGINGNSGRLYFLVFQNQGGQYCSYEIKRCLVLGRKAMTNLDSVLKRRDITFLANVRQVKAMVFPIVMYGWKLNHKEVWVMKNWCFPIVVLEKTLESPLDSKEIQPVLKETSPEYSLEGLMLKLKLKLQYFGHLMQRADSLEKPLMLGKTEGKEEGGGRRWDGQIAFNGHEFAQTPGENERQGSLTCFSPWCHKESHMAPATEQQHSQYHEGPKIETQKRLSVLGKENIGKVLLFISCPLWARHFTSISSYLVVITNHWRKFYFINSWGNC